MHIIGSEFYGGLYIYCEVFCREITQPDTTSRAFSQKTLSLRFRKVALLKPNCMAKWCYIVEFRYHIYDYVNIIFWIPLQANISSAWVHRGCCGVFVTSRIYVWPDASIKYTTDLITHVYIPSELWHLYNHYTSFYLRIDSLWPHKYSFISPK